MLVCQKLTKEKIKEKKFKFCKWIVCPSWQGKALQIFQKKKLKTV